MSRRCLAVLAMVVVIGAAGCSSSGTHTQSLSSSAPSTTGATMATSTDSNRSTSHSASPSGSAKPIPTPTVTPPAQSAVNSYVAMGNVLTAWGADPRKTNGTHLAPYATSTVVKQTVAIFQSMAKQGIAYRGTPDSLNLKVVTTSSESVILSSCPTPNNTDPYTQYVVATGKAVATSTPSVLHPKAITVLFTGGRWRVSSIIPDEGRTCRA